MNGVVSLDRVRCGFLPLMDAAIPIIASERGFARAEGLHLELFRETSWANVRDRMAVGHFDVAHMLAPMPLAAALGLTPLELKAFAPMALGTGGNTVAVSSQVWAELDRGDFDGSAARSGQSLQRVVQARKASGARALTFGVVHPFSCQSYELRYWLAASGIAPDNDVAITVLPPSFMPDALATGQIDGCCVGEPWNSVAAASGAARILTTKADIWRFSVEKVLGVREAWAEQHQDVLTRLLRALYRAAQWCDEPAHFEELAAVLAGPHYIGVPPALILAGLTGRLSMGDQGARDVAGFHSFAANAATFPRTSQAQWLYSQMARWGQVRLSSQAAEACARVFRPDIYRAALEPLGAVATEAQDVGVFADVFFDGHVFDPRRLDAYAAELPYSQAADD